VEALETQTMDQLVEAALAAVNTLMLKEDAKHATPTRLLWVCLVTNTVLKCQSVELDKQEILAPTNALVQPQSVTIALPPWEPGTIQTQADAYVSQVIMVFSQWIAKEDVNAHAT
jgi:hypothetical protein